MGCRCLGLESPQLRQHLVPHFLHLAPGLHATKILLHLGDFAAVIAQENSFFKKIESDGEGVVATVQDAFKARVADGEGETVMISLHVFSSADEDTLRLEGVKLGGFANRFDNVSGDGRTLRTARISFEVEVRDDINHAANLDETGEAAEIVESALLEVFNLHSCFSRCILMHN